LGGEDKIIKTQIIIIIIIIITTGERTDAGLGLVVADDGGGVLARHRLDLGTVARLGL
jgi:hypothetical protein